MFTWFDGHMIAIMFIIPTTVFIAAGWANILLRRRAARKQADRTNTHRTITVHMSADTSRFTQSMDIAASNARQSAFYQRLDDEGRNDRESSLSHPVGDDE